jgi:hypothetical protein
MWHGCLPLDGRLSDDLAERIPVTTLNPVRASHPPTGSAAG